MKNRDLCSWLMDKKQMVMLFFFIVIILVQVIRMGNYPGLYMDSIMSDYASARFINSQKYSSSQFRFIDDFLLIGAFYHGNLTMFWTLFVSLLTGTSSVIQYHIGNACWLILCVAGMQFFLYKQKIAPRIVLLIFLIMLNSPACISTVFTEDYNYLPGTAFLIFSIINILEWKSKEYDYQKLFIAFFWVGLAIYSYIIYAFYFIVLAIICCKLSVKRNFQEYYKILFCAGAGGIAGAFFYVIGFYSIMYGSVTHIISDYAIRRAAFFLTAFVILSINYLGYCLSLREKCYATKAFFAITDIIIILFPVVCNYKYLYSFKRQLITRTEGMAGNSLTINEKLHKLLQRLFTIYSNPRRESDILGEPVSRFSNVFLVTFILLILIWIIFQIIYQNKLDQKNKVIFLLISSQAGYIALLFMLVIGGLNQGHFTTLFFISFLILAMIFSDIYKIVRNSKKTGQTIIKYVLITFLCVNLTINYINTGVFTNQIIRTGGHGDYTHQLTVLAQEALVARESGKKELYVFPEWGFATSFIYLTGNTIPLRQDIGELERIKDFEAEGFTTFVVAFFDEGNKDKYLEYFDEYKEEIKEEIRYTRDGEYGFTILRLEVEPLNE